MDFRSDNITGAHPRIMEALVRANRQRAATPYGGDEITERLQARVRAVFEHDRLVAFPVVTGTAANALSLACIAPPWGAVFCHPQAHVLVDEANAPEFYGAGLKLVAIPGPAGKLDIATLGKMAGAGGRGVHNPEPSAVSISQASECGTTWQPDEIRALAETCRSQTMRLHMDGTRFANSLAFVGCSPPELSWKAGVDVLCLGASKNGALAAELAIFFDPAMAGEFERRRKRGGHLLSKMRFVSTQLEAYLDDDLWLANARHANGMAQRLGGGLAALPGCRLLYPIEANEIFVALPDAIDAALKRAGAKYHPWPGERPGEHAYRFVTAFDTDQTEVDSLVVAARTARAA
jgi:threonine aldolase